MVKLSTFNLEIITPEKKFFSDKVEMIILKTIGGEVGILPQHAPTVMTVAIGNIRIKQNGEWKEAVLTEGFMEVRQDETIILVDTAEWPGEIDVNRAKEAKERAEERLRRQTSQLEYIQSKAAVARAMERLKSARKKK